jgi:LacI family transcriptional regulator
MEKLLLSDLANILGFSKTLVSMVLNGKGDANGISKKTQERVFQLAKELNYSPNNFARGLRIGKSNTIGLIIPDIGNSFYSKFARNIEAIAYKNDYNVIVCSSDEKAEKEEKIINMLLNKNVDGLIISSTLYSPEIYFDLIEKNYPLVLINQNFNNSDFNYVGVDDVEDSFEATSFLLKNGYKNIGFITLGPQHVSSLQDRLEGYKLALKTKRIKIDNSHIKLIPFQYTFKHIEKAIGELIEAKVEAVVFANNNLTLDALKYLDSKKISIPKEFALISFDDIEIFSYTYSPITAIKQPIEKISETAVNILFENIHKTNKKIVQKILASEIVVRGSTDLKIGRL